MIRVASKGKYPKEPREGDFLEICRKDFKNFKDRDHRTIFLYLSALVNEHENSGLNPETIIKQKENLEQIKKLIDKGNEKVAFHQFIRAFPSCLPHRGDGLRL
ncbi:MAG: hypothetical protein EU552_02075 [Promethearchaeota archaeon]|nr:MAG: hypothetical protein EU552_02075 [Candidatus Lokiarchaeota archaeon]